MTGLLSSFVLTTAVASVDVGVALTKRMGVSEPVALARAAKVLAALRLSGEVVDLTYCRGRMSCLVKEARDRRWKGLVTVDTADVLKEALVDVRLLDLAGEGRLLADGTAQAGDAALGVTLEPRLEGVRKAIATLVAPSGPAVKTEPVPPPPPPPPPPPVVDAPVVDAPVVKTASAGAVVAPAAVGPSSARWVPLGVSLGVTAIGGILFGLSAADAERLRDQPRFENLMEVDALVSRGKGLQTAGVIALVSGGVSTVASLVLAALWPQAEVKPAALWVPGGAGMAVTGGFP
ncbi:MAG: hypothetical protein INH41_25285 [Myxococcaceae bacterium]|nr:hypothetical protein [Myxococcaceae bacterium]MCA3015713.1 hypothetical protein [Myxococcaceae bacterium]